VEDKNAAYASRTFKKDKVAWYVLMVFVLAVVWGVEGFRENGRAQLRPWKSPVSNRATISVLEFGRVVSGRSKDLIDQARFRKQLKALEKNGFEAVSLADIFKFYYEGKNLPEKSVLLMFANGYMETYTAVDPILRQMKWPAVMTINTEKVVKRETFFLYWDRLRRMVNSGVWSLVSGGIPANYKVSQNLIETNIPGYKILATSTDLHEAQNYTKFFDPRKSHDRALRKIYPLGFVNGFVGVNDKNSDPFRLRRLRIKPEWDPETLLTLMNQGIQAVTAANKTRSESIWFRSDGESVETSPHQKHHSIQNARLVGVPKAKQGIRIHGAPGASIFFPTGDRTGNWILEADIRLDRGEFWARQNSSKTTGGWRVGGNSENFNAQVRVANGPYENLAGSRPGIPLGKWYHLKLIKRGKGIIVGWNGANFWDFPLYLPDDVKGNIALQVWSREGEGSLSVSDAKISIFPHDIRWLKSYPGINDIQLLIKYTEKVSGVTTVTHEIQGNQAQSVSFDEDLFLIISHRYGWDFIPTLRVLPQKKSSGKPDSEYERNNEYENT